MHYLILILAAFNFYQQSNSSGVMIVHTLPYKEISSHEPVMRMNASIPAMISIDNGKKESLAPNKNITFDSLDLSKKHLFGSYSSNGKLIDSFYFSFKKEGSDTLHLQFNAGYANWRFTER